MGWALLAGFLDPAAADRISHNAARQLILWYELA
jgi:hypothetical protein